MLSQVIFALREHIEVTLDDLSYIKRVITVTWIYLKMCCIIYTMF